MVCTPIPQVGAGARTHIDRLAHNGGAVLASDAAASPWCRDFCAGKPLCSAEDGLRTLAATRAA